MENRGSTERLAPTLASQHRAMSVGMAKSSFFAFNVHDPHRSWKVGGNVRALILCEERPQMDPPVFGNVICQSINKKEWIFASVGKATGLGVEDIKILRASHREADGS